MRQPATSETQTRASNLQPMITSPPAYPAARTLGRGAVRLRGQGLIYVFCECCLVVTSACNPPQLHETSDVCLTCAFASLGEHLSRDMSHECFASTLHVDSATPCHVMFAVKVYQWLPQSAKLSDASLSLPLLPRASFSLCRLFACLIVAPSLRV